jgi:hypothetical protein
MNMTQFPPILSGKDYFHITDDVRPRELISTNKSSIWYHGNKKEGGVQTPSIWQYHTTEVKFSFIFIANSASNGACQKKEDIREATMITFAEKKYVSPSITVLGLFTSRFVLFMAFLLHLTPQIGQNRIVLMHRFQE